MPKVKPLGSDQMKAIANAAREAEARAEAENSLVLEGLDILQRRAGFKNKRLFAESIGLTDARYRYIRSNPGAIRLDEIRRIQAYAGQYGTRVCFSADNERMTS